MDETDAFVDGSHSTTVNRAERFEMATLRLLGSHVGGGEKLTPAEIQAISTHLTANYPLAVDGLSVEQVQQFVASTPITILPTPKVDLGQQLPDELLYEKGTPSNFCTFVLSGRMTVIAGSDNFRTDVSSWTLLAISALRNPEYKPDFTAFVCEGPFQCLQFTRENFMKVLANEGASASADRGEQDNHCSTMRDSSSAEGQDRVTELASRQIDRKKSKDNELRIDDKKSKWVAALQVTDSKRKTN